MSPCLRYTRAEAPTTNIASVAHVKSAARIAPIPISPASSEDRGHDDDGNRRELKFHECLQNPYPLSVQRALNRTTEDSNKAASPLDLRE
jgi:hypothetical protein